MSEGLVPEAEVKVFRHELPQIPSPESTEALYNALIDHRGRPVDLVASRVNRISVPLVQVLIAAASEWKAIDLPFRVVEPSEAFKEGVALLGLPDDTLQVEEAA